MADQRNLTPPEIELDFHGEVIVFDLDDTLYPERDYMMSGFRAIVVSVQPTGGQTPEALVERMAGAFDRGANALDELADCLGLSGEVREAAIREWVVLYRRHTPTLKLAEETEHTLSSLSARGVALGLITDGRSVAQRGKIAALGLDRYFSADNIYISEEHGAGKESMEPFAYMVHRYPEAKGFSYVADNPAKDFLNPNLMGWRTICLLDKGGNIHPQKADVAEEYRPQLTISSLRELLSM